MKTVKVTKIQLDELVKREVQKLVKINELEERKASILKQINEVYIDEPAVAEEGIFDIFSKKGDEEKRAKMKNFVLNRQFDVVRSWAAKSGKSEEEIAEKLTDYLMKNAFFDGDSVKYSGSKNYMFSPEKNAFVEKEGSFANRPTAY